MGNAPYAMDMKPARYEDYYKAPWATSREFEERHRRICAEVGASLKDVGIMGYIILYGLTLFNISPEELLQAEIPEKDIAVIKKVRIFFYKLSLHLMTGS